MSKADEIAKTYIEYKHQKQDKNSIDVILISPKTMDSLRKEAVEIATDIKNRIPYSLTIMGSQIPLIIKNTLPENMTCLIMSKESYEELQRLQKIEEWFG